MRDSAPHPPQHQVNSPTMTIRQHLEAIRDQLTHAESGDPNMLAPEAHEHALAALQLLDEATGDEFEIDDPEDPEDPAMLAGRASTDPLTPEQQASLKEHQGFGPDA